MSIKPIEMQGSVPRSQNIGKIQEQLQQRGQNAQEQIASDHLKEHNIKRKQVNESKEAEQPKNNKEGQGNGSQNKQKEKEKKQQEMKKAYHPYKGKFIDYSG
ncbi:hypothetical protein [Bacillus alkalicellulosilyticus]|uniref:hypothetical protein n=1 Tax=Alkalihalobacterium alkalicellulosilyticum TaxID=1912214 RepID=UPI0009977479|nr:hypothetical protein [Bacillus alkalicellulosilyticus]